MQLSYFIGMSETREQILEEIKIQGDLVRKLKAAKEPKEKVSAGPTKHIIICMLRFS